MPMHDWTRVDAGIYHHLHAYWLTQTGHALNNGALPEGYYALTEQVVYPYGPDVVALTPRDAASPPAGGTAVAVSPPAVAGTARAAKNIRRRTYRRLSVRQSSDHRVVAVIELMSPGNKSSRRDFDGFLNKAVALLDGGVHLLVIDPFLPTRRDPAGIHAAIWKALTRKSYPPSPDRPLTAASYVGGEEVRVYVDPFAVGLPVPTMPLFLTPDEYVNVPLEATYQTAFAEVPAVWRAVLEAP
jgi:hypothetical protein